MECIPGFRTSQTDHVIADVLQSLNKVIANVERAIREIRGATVFLEKR
jgi:hypothetical protein